ncbi:MAG TPA: hypothetical protein VMG12_32075 [Polyangiaceae bacterium]|nr:hypothetical protein [Polyangiaceae bacterium]
MNSFGHAWVAAWFSVRAPFLLGSILPDLASALRTSVPRALEPELAAGIQLHHDTDRVFHTTGAFQSLEHHARTRLADAGLSKGPRRALAHIGIEFLIDDELGRDDDALSQAATRPAAVARYAAALRFGASPSCRSLLHWSNAADADRFALLCHRLGNIAVPANSARPADADRRLSSRLIACLSGRPRLELQPHETLAIEPWLADCRPHVAAITPSLLAELAQALEAPSLEAAE